MNAMLLLVVFFSLIADAPAGLIALINMIDADAIPSIHKVMPAFDTLNYVNMSCNFFIYCGMSKQFRRSLRGLLTGSNGDRQRRLSSRNAMIRGVAMLKERCIGQAH